MKPPQQNYDMQKVLRVRVRGTRDQIGSMLAELSRLNELERRAPEKTPADRFGVMLGWSGPYGNEAAQWGCHFWVGAHLEQAIRSFAQALQLQEERAP